jgi:hypothetical protein
MSVILACPNGHELANATKFCPECGASLSTAMPQGDPQQSAVADPADSIELGSASEPTPPKRRKSRRPLLIAVAILLVLGVAGAVGAWAFVYRETAEDRYLASLESAAVMDQYGSSEVALAQGQAFCTGLRAGDQARGYQREAIAVDHLCPEFSDGFEVVPTPEELAIQLTAKLREEGLGGEFASDAAAVAHARNVCTSLKQGGPQQGPEVDAVAVEIYCPAYASGFKTLRPINVKGSFTLRDTSSSIYYQSIVGSNGDCEGDSGYGDITPGTEVVVKDNSGTVLTTTQLGSGRGFPPVMCKFRFSFTVMDGAEGGYVISVADRGDLHYSAAQLKVPGSVAITLGD